jgi:TRAP-type C4-dicarboxylate transport system permease small subunit
VFLAASYTMRTGGHVRVSLLSQSIPPAIAHMLDILATLIGTAIAIFLAYSLILFAYQSGVTGRTSPTIDETPLVIPQGVIAFGAALLALQMVVRSIRLISGEPAEDDEAKQDFGVSE